MDKRILVTALVSAIGGGVIGGAVTYVSVKKTFAARAQRDIDDVKQSYAEKFDGKRVVNNFAMTTPVDEDESVKVPTITEEEKAAAKEFAEKLLYSSVPKEETLSDEDQTLSIYDRVEVPHGEEVESPLLIGYDREALRAAHKPYLISSEEFYQTETEWEKLSIAYYEDDDVLADEREKVVDDIEYLVGEKHLEFFGLRSGDNNIVFVRNPQISADIEVTRNAGSYTEIVLGVPKDSDRVGVRRMRAGDDG